MSKPSIQVWPDHRMCDKHQIRFAFHEDCPYCIAEIEQQREMLKRTPIAFLMPEGIEAMVCIEIAARQAKGIQKYGTTVANNPLSLREWLQHALEECLDQAVYLRRAIAEIDAKEGK